MLALCTAASAATYTVTEITDDGTGTTVGSLSWAISQVIGGGDIIEFSLASGNTVTLSGELPVITSSVTIDGGDGVTITVETPGTSTFRVFNINASGEAVTLANLTLVGGDISSETAAASYGGVVYVAAGTVTISECLLSGATAYRGGALYVVSGATVTVADSTLSANTATGYGGAVYNNGTFTISGSTISDNTANQNGGGIYNNMSEIYLNNVTISGNAASSGSGGGLYNYDMAVLVNVTISGNTAHSDGGGMYNAYVCYMLNSIIVNNTCGFSGEDIYNDDSTYAYYCWYHSTSGSIYAEANATNVTLAYTAGDLGALADNGGPTYTMALSSLSPAYEVGTFAYYNGTDGYYFLDAVGTSHKVTDWHANPTVVAGDKITTDQRGETRVSPASMGAYNEAVPAAVPLTLVFDTSLSSGTTVGLPLYDSVNVTADWGDGSNDTYTTTGVKPHTYAADGCYTVKVSGTLTRFGSGSSTYSGADKLTDVQDFGEIGLTKLYGAFNGASNLTNVPASLPSGIDDLSDCFHGASKFNGDISGWDVSNVLYLSYTFYNATNFNGNIGGWNVGSVETMNYTFNNAASFNADIGSWDVGKVSTFYRTFYNAKTFNQDIGGWNVGSATTMGGMFYNAPAFNQNLNSWAVTNVTNMRSMFGRCSSFNGNIANWNVSRVTDMYELFYYATNFNQDIGSWNVSSVNNMDSMFSRSAFNRDLGGWVPTNVLTMDYMFYYDAAFNRNIGSWNVSHVQTMREMFHGAASFDQDIGGWDVGSVTNMYSMFSGATAFDEDLGAWNISDVINMADMFNGVKLSTLNYDSMLTNWAAQTVQPNVTFSAGNSLYSQGAAQTARQSLVADDGWTISDGGMFTYAVSTNNGPYAGGGAITITNCNMAIGGGSDITNVLVDGVSATITGQGTNWVAFILPPATHSGAVNIVVQSGSVGETVFSGAYAYNPAGWIIDYETIKDWTRWMEVEELPVALRYMNSGTLNGKLYAFGGSDLSSVVHSNVYAYDGTNWTEVASLPKTNRLAAVGVLNNTLYSIGGNSGGNASICSNVYAFDGTSWSETVSLPVRRDRMGGAVYNGRIYAAGGTVGGITMTNMYAFDGTNWTQELGLPMALNVFQMETLNGYMYCFGGNGGVTNVYRYDGTNWTADTALPKRLTSLGSAVFQGKIYAIGGSDGTNTQSAVYSFDGTNWTTEPSLPAKRAYLTANILGDYLYAIAGNQPPTNSVYVYPAYEDVYGVSPSSGSWTGNYPVAITGTNMGNGADITNVTLCGVAATVVSQTAERVWVTAAAVTNGMTGDVVVQSTSFGETIKSNAFTYTSGELILLGANGAEIASGNTAQVADGSKFSPVLFGAAWTNTFGITNGGNEALGISGYGISDPAFQVPDMPDVVDVGAVSNFTVVYSPTSIGSDAAALVISNNTPDAAFTLNLAGSCFAASTNVGPYAGGNTVTFTNGNFGAITNVLVGGVVATIVDSGTSWVTVTMPSIGTNGMADVVVQTSDNGDITLADAYTYNPAGEIGKLAQGPDIWTNLAAGVNGYVQALAWDGANLYVGGRFTTADGLTANHVAKWDGASWTNLGDGVDGDVYALTWNGSDLYAGGRFTTAGGISANHVAKWDGSSWTNLGSGLSTYAVYALAHDGTTLYAGGENATTVGGMSQWDGTNWTAVGTKVSSSVQAVVLDGTNLYAGGHFTGAFGVSADYVAKWDGSSWSSLGDGVNSTVWSLRPIGSDLYVGGVFSTAGVVSVSRMAKWDGASWTNMGAGVNDTPYAMAANGSELYVGGGFTNAGGLGIRGVATWDGNSWTNAGVNQINSSVRALLSNGTNLYAGGYFTQINTSIVNYVAMRESTLIIDGGATPSSGSWKGGYAVVISGTNLCNGSASDVTGVTLCGVTAAVTGVSGSTQIVVTAGASAGLCTGDVVVVSADYGTTVKSNVFTYVSPALTVLGTNGAAIATGNTAQLADGSKFKGLTVGAAGTNVFAITNRGASALTISGVTTNGANAAAFDLSGLPSVVAAGGASNFTVIYTPSAIGSDAAAVVFESDDFLSPFTFNLAGSCFAASTNVGPYAGGNTVTFTNGNFGTITNVLVGGVAATIIDSGMNWVTVTMPSIGTNGTADVVVQTSDNGDTVLTDAYTYNPAGSMGGMVVDGFVWTNMAQGFNSAVYAVFTATNGDIYAGGSFTQAMDGAESLQRVARWDGAAWTNMGIGFNNTVRGIQASAAGTLYTMGDYNGTYGFNQNCRRVGRWDGANWTNMGLGFSTATYAMAMDTNDMPYVGGAFTSDGYQHYFGCAAKWDGANWTNIYGSVLTNGLGFSSSVRALLTAPDGKMYFAGDFTNAITPSGTTAMARVAMWDGTDLHELGDGFNGSVYALALDGAGNLYAGGLFTASGSQAMYYVARWDGAGWTNVGNGMNGPVYALAVDANDNLYAGGSFNAPGAKLAMWDGANWNGMSASEINGDVYALTPYSNETMLAGGGFSYAGAATNRIGLVHPNRYYSSGTTPSSGSWTGGYAVAIVGENIGAGDVTNVTLCGVSATIRSQTVDRVWVTAGAAAAAGPGDVVVQSVGFGTTIGTNAFAYLAPGLQVLGTNGAAIASGADAQSANGTKFPPLLSGASWTNAFSVTNNGTETVILSGWGCSDSHFEIAGLPASVVAGGVSNFTVRFTPDAVGSFAGTLTISNDSPTAAYVVNLAGSCFSSSTNVGPYAGGNVVTFTNGDFGAITNVLVDGVAATIVDSGTSWFTVAMPSIGTNGTADVVVQTSDNGDVTLADAYTYNPAGWIIDHEIFIDWSRWMEVEGMPAGLRYVNSGTLNGKLYAFGGSDYNGVIYSNAYAYDGTNWTEVASLPKTNRQAAVGALNNVLYSIAGNAGGNSTICSNVYAYDGANWTEVPGMPTKRDKMGSAVYNGKIHMAGGTVGGMTMTNVYVYDGTNFTQAAGLPVALSQAQMEPLNGYLYAFGGNSGITNVYRYDGANWTEDVGLPSPLTFFGSAVLDGKIYAIGGTYGGNEQSAVYCFDGTNWTAAPSLPVERAWLTAKTLGDYIYTMGGGSGGGVQSALTNVFSYPYREEAYGAMPSSGSWAGNYPVVITGTNLGNGADVTNVTLCGVSATVRSQTVDRVWVTAGAAAAVGPGDVRVYSVSYGQTVKSNAFEYLRAAQAALTFAPTTPQAYGTTNGLAASGGSGTGAVSFAVTSGPGLMVGATNLTITAGTGEVVVVATKAQDDLYFAAASTATVAAAKADQAIADFLPTNGSAFVATDAVGLGASAGSGLAVAFAVAGGPGSIAGGTNLTFSTSGTVSIVASQAGDANWNAAPAVTQAFVVAKASQAALVFAPASPQTYGTTNALSATGGSGTGTVSYSISAGLGEIVGTNGLHALAGTGSVTVAATKAADDVYLSAATTATVAYAKAAATVFLLDLAQVYDGTARVLSATTMPAGLTVEFTYDGNAWAPTNAGSYAVTGTVNDANWQGSAAGTLAVARGQDVIVFGNTNQVYDSTGKAVTATAGSGSPVAVTYDGTTNLPVNVGTYAVTGIVNAANWQATNVAALTISKADQVITNFLPVDGAQFVLGASTGISAQASSGLTVGFTNLTPEIADLAGTTITFTNPGLARVQAFQAGDTNWNAATPVVHEWRVGGLITNVAPGAANVGGGIEVLIQGVSLGNGSDVTNVTLAGVAATIVTQSVGDVTVKVEPAAAAATGDVTVASATGGFMVLSNAFEYLWLDAPAMLPPTDVTLYDLMAHWTGVPAATNYFLEVGLDAGFAATLPGYGPLDAGAETNALVAGLLDETDYWLRAYSWNAAGSSLPSPARKTSTPAVALHDFDADGCADLAAYQPATGLWNLLSFATGRRWDFSWGWSSAIPVPADYDGDGLSDIAVYHPATGNWHIHYSTGTQPAVIQFGWSATVPVPADYDGDGTADLAVYHAADGRWYFRCSTAGDYGVSWGWSAAVPVPADYDGDGKADIAVYHPATGEWYILKSLSQTMMNVQWGWCNAVPVPGDYDGDGKADIAVFHRATGNWHIRYSTGIHWDVLNFGWAGTIPVQADYDGDGQTDRAVYHPATGNWHIRRSSNDAIDVLQNGGPDQIPALLYPMIHTWFGLP